MQMIGMWLNKKHIKNIAGKVIDLQEEIRIS